MIERPFNMSITRLVTRLNRISRCLRNDYPGENPREVAARMADEVDAILYKASQVPGEIDNEIATTLGELLPEYSEFRKWQFQLSEAIKDDPDALLNWWRYGFEDTPTG